jgi:hypothetical protein
MKERVNANNTFLDSSNLRRTKGQVVAMETARSMDDQPINVVHQLVMGNFTPAPLKVINQKHVLLSVVAYSSLSTEQLQQLGDNLDRAKARMAQMSEKEMLTST